MIEGRCGASPGVQEPTQDTQGRRETQGKRENRETQGEQEELWTFSVSIQHCTTAIIELITKIQFTRLSVITSSPEKQQSQM